MYWYVLVDFLALLVLLITNHDVLFRSLKSKKNQRHKWYYHLFLLNVIVYYLTDISWALLYEHQQLAWLYLDTELYFVVMALGILLWSRFVTAYLQMETIFSRFLFYAGAGLLLLVAVLTPINRFWPVMFWFDSTGVYQTGAARNGVFLYQVFFLLLTSLYTLTSSARGNEKQRKRNLTVGLSGFIMLCCVTIQIFFPTYPLYAISYMLGCCLLRTFVIENEREEYRSNLEIALAREQRQLQELKRAWDKAYKDSLTGVKNKLAYIERVSQIEEQISQGKVRDFALAVMDLNELKIVNDTLGHDAGDDYIRSGCRLICSIFKYSPVYRIGGDEFVVFLAGYDYENKDNLFNLFKQEILKNRRQKDVVVAAGMAEYLPQQDRSYEQVFQRADEMMYRNKREIKAMAKENVKNVS